jgi:hypothetical protein
MRGPKLLDVAVQDGGDPVGVDVKRREERKRWVGGM